MQGPVLGASLGRTTSHRVAPGCNARSNQGSNGRKPVVTCRSALATPARPATSEPRGVQAPQAPYDKEETRTLLNLTSWAIANKVVFSGVRPEARGGQRGVYALGDISSGDTLVAVPTTSALTISPGEKTPFQEFVPQDVWVGLPWYAQLACKILHERALGPASRYADYVAALPRSVDLPALWPPAHVAQLGYTYLEQQILDEQEEWSRLCDRLAPHLSRRQLAPSDLRWALSCVRSRTFAGPHFPTPPSVKLAAGAAAALVAAVALSGLGGEGGGLGAAVPLAAAALGAGVPLGLQAAEAKRATSGEPGTVLYAVCPLTDMFNHSSRVQTECVFAPWRSQFRVVAAEGVRRGGQVLINYGSQSNDALLQRYGFVEPDSPQDRYVLGDVVDLLARAADEGAAALGGLTGQAVRDAARQLGSSLPPRDLQQVAVTPAGAPDATLAAVREVLRGAGCATDPRVAVAVVCQEELRRLGATREDDEAALQQLQAWEEYTVRRAARLEELAAREEEARRRREAQAEAGAGQEVAAEAAPAGASAGAVEGTESEGSGQQQQHVEGQEGAEQQQEEQVEEQEEEQEEEPVLPPLGLMALDGHVDRYRTVMRFRIAKKRVLQQAAGPR